MKMLLTIDNLSVSIEQRPVVRSFSCSLALGSITALMGPNGSGKSSLVLALAGHPRYTVTEGSCTLAGDNLLALPIHQRAKAGLFVAFQQSPEIPGIQVVQQENDIQTLHQQLQSTERQRQKLQQAIERKKLAIFVLEQRTQTMVAENDKATIASNDRIKQLKAEIQQLNEQTDQTKQETNQETLAIQKLDEQLRVKNEALDKANDLRKQQATLRQTIGVMSTAGIIGGIALGNIIAYVGHLLLHKLRS